LTKEVAAFMGAYFDLMDSDDDEQIEQTTDNKRRSKSTAKNSSSNNSSKNKTTQQYLQYVRVGGASLQLQCLELCNNIRLKLRTSCDYCLSI
jgi:BRCT domain type II-containing protein